MKEKILEDKEFKTRRIDELAQYLGYVETTEYISFIKMMNALEDEGEIVRNKVNEYYLSNQLYFFKGVVYLNKKGFSSIKKS